MVLGETRNKLCLVPGLVLLKFPVSQHPPIKASHTVRYTVTLGYDTVRRYGTVPFGTRTVFTST